MPSPQLDYLPGNGPLPPGSTACLDLIVSNPLRDPVELKELRLTLPLGSGANDLLAPGASQPVAEVRTPDGIIADADLAQEADAWTVTITLKNNEHPGTPAQLTRDPLVITLNGLLINDQPGDTTVTCAETTPQATTATTLPLTKARSTTATRRLWAFGDGEDRPRTTVTAGQPLTLAWNSQLPPGQALYYGGRSVPLDEGSTHCPLPGGIQRTTAFTLWNTTQQQAVDTLAVTVLDPHWNRLDIDQALTSATCTVGGRSRNSRHGAATDVGEAG
ncbi:hypothetical protein [Streptomyces sp. x-80]|jgi:hypothetical protein|uniref:hypothetical protein n=1 Tax=Streptomyces sp. x-80 TaxID=2789282 RepID=UPI003980C51B